MKRSRFQGIGNVLRFNWHFFVLGMVAMLAFMIAGLITLGGLSKFFFFAAICAALGLWLPMIATAWAYDLTGLYQFKWIAPWLNDGGSAANIHAGFDESSTLLRSEYPQYHWQVFDFYDAKKHKEISIQRARLSAPEDPNVVAFSSDHFPVPSASLDRICLVLAAHEIRNLQERIEFFKELRRALKPKGCVIVTEHLRDFPNLLAYSLGVLHFHSRNEWLRTYQGAGFEVAEEIRINLFVTTFILK